MFKSKGIKRIQGVAGELWGKSLEEGERWGFVDTGDRASSYILELDSVENEEEENVTSFDFKTDPQKIAEILNREYNAPIEPTKQNYENLEKNENLLFMPIIKEGDEIVALSLLFQDEVPGQAVQVHSFIEDSKYYSLIQNSINRICKDKGIKRITIFFRAPTFKFAKEYEKLGFVFETKTILLEKSI